MTADVYTVFRVFQITATGAFKPIRGELNFYYDDKFLEGFISIENAAEAIKSSSLLRAEYVVLPVVAKRS